MLFSKKALSYKQQWKRTSNRKYKTPGQNYSGKKIKMDPKKSKDNAQGKNRPKKRLGKINDFI